MDAEGNPSATGDAPQGWVAIVGVSPGAPATPYRIFALCSATSDATVSTTETSGTGYSQATQACPPRTRAVGGGAGTTGPIGSYDDFVIATNSPLDAVGTVTSTDDGDVVAVAGLAEAPGWEGVVRAVREDR